MRLYKWMVVLSLGSVLWTSCGSDDESLPTSQKKSKNTDQDCSFINQFFPNGTAFPMGIEPKDMRSVEKPGKLLEKWTLGCDSVTVDLIPAGSGTRLMYEMVVIKGDHNQKHKTAIIQHYNRLAETDKKGSGQYYSWVLNFEGKPLLEVNLIANPETPKTFEIAYYLRAYI